MCCWHSSSDVREKVNDTLWFSVSVEMLQSTLQHPSDPSHISIWMVLFSLPNSSESFAGRNTQPIYSLSAVQSALCSGLVPCMYQKSFGLRLWCTRVVVFVKRMAVSKVTAQSSQYSRDGQLTVTWHAGSSQLLDTVPGWTDGWMGFHSPGIFRWQK